MNSSLPNITAEAFGFTIPTRSSSLRDRSKQSSKHRKQSSLDKSRTEVAQHMRSSSLVSREESIRRGTFLEISPPTPGRTLDWATPCSASTVSSNAPFSLYRAHNSPAIHTTENLLGQTSLRIKTFRATKVPDPHDNPDIRAHPANGLSETPNGQMRESPISPLVNTYPLNGTSESQCDYISEPSTSPTTPVSVHAPFPSKQTEGTTNISGQAPAVIPKILHCHIAHMILEQISCNMHDQDTQNYIQPIKETVYTPAQHFAADKEGKVTKIPDALSETLKMVKEREARPITKNMGWE